MVYFGGSHPVDPGMGEDWLHQAPGLTCFVVYNVYKHATVDESKFTFRSIAFHSSLWLEHAHSHRFCFPGLRDVCLLIKNALNWRMVILHGSHHIPGWICWSSSMVHRPKVFKKTNDDPKGWALQNMPETTPAKLVGGIPTPLKNMNVSWDFFPNIWKNKIHVPNHQPANQLNTAAKVSGLFKSAAAFSKQSTTSCQVLLVFRDAMSCFYQTERPNAKQ